jgi:hypothetical protein
MNERVIYSLNEEQYLPLDPVFWFVTLVYAYRAFEVPELNDLSVFYSLRVLSGLKQLVILFRDDILNTPIFRVYSWH